MKKLAPDPPSKKKRGEISFFHESKVIFQNINFLKKSICEIHRVVKFHKNIKFGGGI